MKFKNRRLEAAVLEFHRLLSMVKLIYRVLMGLSVGNCLEIYDSFPPVRTSIDSFMCIVHNVELRILLVHERNIF